jgi:hypothetical protein
MPSFRKTRLSYLVLAVGLLAVLFSLLHPPERKHAANGSISAGSSTASIARPPESSAPSSEPDHSPLADEINAPGNTPQRDLEILKQLLGQFTSTLKPQYAPPLGDNQDITAALTGHNKLHVVFIPPDHPAIDAKGRLLDRWGTPYFFHARSADTFDIRSAGPDKILFTEDDVVRMWK